MCAVLAVMLANSGCLATITFLEWLRAPAVCQIHFSLWMFLAHLVPGLLLVVPFLVFAVNHIKNTRR